MTYRRLIALVLFTCYAMAQKPAGGYHLKFENDVVAVYEVDLSPHASVPPLESAHDNLWLGLTSGNASFSVQQGKSDFQFGAGDARFFPSFETKLVTNTGSESFRAAVIVLKARGLVSNGCECTGNTGKTVCGCKGGGHLESLWAFSLGDVTLAGTSLAPGEAFRSAAVRDDMLLVAVTDLILRDEAASAPNGESGQSPAMNLKSGDAIWIKSGRHQFKNLATEPVRFVTVEF